MGAVVSKCGACGAKARKRARVVLVRGKTARTVWACSSCFRASIAFLFVPELRGKLRKARPRKLPSLLQDPS